MNQLNDQQKKGFIGCLAIVVIAIILLIGVPVFNVVYDNIKEEELTTDQQNKISEDINKFQEAAQTVVNDSGGVIIKVTMKDVEKEDYYIVNADVSETAWAASSESAKASFATTLATNLKNLAAPNEIYVYVISATNGDILASPNFSTGGYTIER